MTINISLNPYEAISIVPAGTSMENVINILIPSGTYLSDLNWASATTGYGQVRKDKNASNSTIKLNGLVFKKGLGVHANSEIIYNLGGQYTRFMSNIGPDDNTLTDPNLDTSIYFKVYGDGQLLYDSGLMVTAPTYTLPKEINIDITGINQLKLVVTDAGDGINTDNAVWANARVN